MAERSKIQIRDLEHVTATSAKNNFGELLDRVTFDKERVLVQRGGKPSIVMLSLDDHSRLIERAKQVAGPEFAAPEKAHISATYAKNNFGEMVHRVRYEGEQLVVKRGAKPVAVVMSVDEYQQFRDMSDQPTLSPVAPRVAGSTDVAMPRVDLKLGVAFPTVFAKSWNELAWLTERGCSAVQLNPRWVRSLPDDEQKNLGNELADRGVELAAWSAYRSLVGPDAQVEQHVTAIEQVIDLAAYWGTERCPAIVVGETGSWNTRPDRSPAWIWSNLIATASRLARRAAQRGVVFAVTPNRSHVVSDSVMARKLLDEVGEESLAVCFDPATVCADRETARQACQRLSDAIVLMQARDVRFGPDGLFKYQPAGQGSLDYRQVLAQVEGLPRLRHLMLHNVDTHEDAEKAIEYLKPFLVD